jgi:hypothetical protein
MKIKRHRSPAIASSLQVRPFGLQGTIVLAIGLALVATVTLAMAQVPGKQDKNVRAAKELEFLEGLLVDNIQDAIEAAVQEVNATTAQAAEEATPDPDVNEATIEITYMFRTSGGTVARGMLLEDYGVIFTVQVPTIGTVPAARYLMPGGEVMPFAVLGPDSVLAHSMATEIQVRTRMSMLEREIAELSHQLEEILAEEPSEESEQLAQTIAELRTVYDSFAASKEEKVRKQGKERADVAEGQRQVGSSQPGWGGSERGIIATYDPGAQARARKEAEKRKVEVENAVVDAVVGTLAQYGHVFHGLEDSDRLAVVLFPSSYLNPMQRWLRATSRAEEFVISVSYGDLMQLDEGLITPEEFSDRARLETRLGGARQRNGQD